MADLRAVVAGLGYGDVRTILNSGNVLFDGEQGASPNRLAPRIQAAIAEQLGVSARVLVLAAEEVAEIVRDNPIPGFDDPSRFLVAFVATPEDLGKLEPLTRQVWAPDQFVVGPRAAYLWCAGGILESRMLPAFTKVAGDAVTTRNWATVLKLVGADG
jgi:uncharacterized protein (DUF1697 family)